MGAPSHRRADRDAEATVGEPTVETGDLSLAAYFLARGRERGLRFVGAVLDPSGRTRDPFYRFADPKDQAAALAAEYAGSAEMSFDTALRTLKKIARSGFGPGVFAGQGGRHAGGGRSGG